MNTPRNDRIEPTFCYPALFIGIDKGRSMPMNNNNAG